MVMQQSESWIGWRSAASDVCRLTFDCGEKSVGAFFDRPLPVLDSGRFQSFSWPMLKNVVPSIVFDSVFHPAEYNLRI